MASVIVLDASVLVYGLGQVRRWCKDERKEILIVPLEGNNTFHFPFTSCNEILTLDLCVVSFFVALWLLSDDVLWCLWFLLECWTNLSDVMILHLCVHDADSTDCCMLCLITFSSQHT